MPAQALTNSTRDRSLRSPSVFEASQHAYTNATVRRLAASIGAIALKKSLMAARYSTCGTGIVWNA